MKQRVINYLLKHLLNSVSPDDIIATKNGMLCIGGAAATDDEIRSLSAEIKALEGFRIWRLMNETVRDDAMDRGFNKSTSFQDLLMCKMILYTLDIFDSIIKVVKNRDK